MESQGHQKGFCWVRHQPKTFRSVLTGFPAKIGRGELALHFCPEPNARKGAIERQHPPTATELSSSGSMASSAVAALLVHPRLSIGSRLR